MLEEAKEWATSLLESIKFGSGLEPWQNSLIATAFISLCPILILLFVPIFKKEKVGSQVKEVIDESLLKVLVSFAVGGLLGDVFLHLIPHSFVPHSHNHGIFLL